MKAANKGGIAKDRGLAIGGVLLLLLAVPALIAPWLPIAEQMMTILTAALVASLYPALRASQTPATELRRDDV